MSEEKKLGKETSEKVANEFKSFKDKEYSKEEIDSVFRNEDKIKSKTFKGALKQYAQTIKLFFEMLKDFFQNKYTETPKTTIAAIIGTLLYVLSPFDIIGDFIPFLGLLDDAFAVALCIKFAQADIEKYKAWKEKQNDSGKV